ncbi:helix-turn-helix transcriptional regulator [Nocardioides sp. IC4_145]|uniref:helix-turn-helix transcriptional regulator n=1 Tax=Nocardioides sp. IC4_145 TaxID=2714037 RepID=UPI0014077C19|nr:helix-turn-helix transcriptional regulator [Nocardioides sp. IC4_145]NHC25506.1 helix-turn-helix transcriptional regulator [Nocardioides sp. IC4_145]
MDAHAQPVKPSSVQVLAEHQLMGEAVAAALSSRGRPVATSRWRYGPVRASGPGPTSAQAVVRSGVLVCEVEDPLSLAAACALVRRDAHRWLVVASGAGSARWGALLAAGAGGVLDAAASIDQMYGALEAVEAGDDVPADELRDSALSRWAAVPPEERRLLVRLERLTPREREVLAGLRAGQSAAVLAWNLDISMSTVRSQVRAVLRKLDVNAQLAAVAVVTRLEGSSALRA